MLAKLVRFVPMHGATSLYEYPSHDLNVYADEDMTMEVAEPATTPWTVNAFTSINKCHKSGTNMRGAVTACIGAAASNFLAF